jgi:hypothetical protein
MGPLGRCEPQHLRTSDPGIISPLFDFLTSRLLCIYSVFGLCVGDLGVCSAVDDRVVVWLKPSAVCRWNAGR